MNKLTAALGLAIISSLSTPCMAMEKDIFPESMIRELETWDHAALRRLHECVFYNQLPMSPYHLLGLNNGDTVDIKQLRTKVVASIEKYPHVETALCCLVNYIEKDQEQEEGLADEMEYLDLFLGN